MVPIDHNTPIALSARHNLQQISLVTQEFPSLQIQGPKSPVPRLTTWNATPLRPEGIPGDAVKVTSVLLPGER